MPSQSKIANIAGRIATFKNWYKLVLPFNRLFVGEQRLLLRRGSTPLYVRSVFSTDPAIAIEMFGGGEYPLADIRLPKKPTIVDVGANIGVFCVACHLEYLDAHIVSYEPHPESFRLLRKNAPFAVAIQKALAGRRGSVQFQEHGAAAGLRMVESGGLTVDAITLEDALAPLAHVDLLKIDIEGAEQELLDASGPETLHKVDRILMEVHTSIPEHVAWAERTLRRFGFVLCWIAPSRVVYAWRE